MGKAVGAAVGARLGRALLELGGNNAIIISDQADLDNDGDPAQALPDGGVDINDLLFFLARFEIGDVVALAGLIDLFDHRGERFGHSGLSGSR